MLMDKMYGWILKQEKIYTSTFVDLRNTCFLEDFEDFEVEKYNNQ